jgi:antitoxin CptB
MSETPQDRIKKMRMRSWRRGMRELDLLLGPFADAELARLSPEALDLYDDMLSENDQDLYAWVNKRSGAPARYEALLQRIAAFHDQS